MSEELARKFTKKENTNDNTKFLEHYKVKVIFYFVFQPVDPKQRKLAKTPTKEITMVKMESRSSDDEV